MLTVESWQLTQPLEKYIQSCNSRMLHFFSCVSLQDGVSNEVVAQMCCMMEILDVARVRRLQYFSHVPRREEEEALLLVRKWHVELHHQRGRLKKSWKKMLQEEMRMMEINKDLAYG